MLNHVLSKSKYFFFFFQKNSIQLGFFAEVGPLQVFVSSHLIPGWKFDDASPIPSFISEDENLRLEKDKDVRIRILGTHVNGNEFTAVGEFLQLFV